MAQPCGNPGCTNYKADGEACCLSCEQTLWGTRGKYQARPPSVPMPDPLLTAILAKLDEAIALNASLTERMDAITKMLGPLPPMKAPKDTPELREALTRLQHGSGGIIMSYDDDQGPVIDADDRVRFTIYLDHDALERLKRYCVDTERDVNGLLVDLIEEGLDVRHA
jgi:hypothetical protein